MILVSIYILYDAAELPPGYQNEVHHYRHLDKAVK